MNHDARRLRLYATLALLGTVGLAGCEGGNLFQSAIASGEGGPTATITSPDDGSTVGLNSSLGVGFDIGAPEGAASYTVVGRYVGQDTEAYQSVTQSLTATSLSAFATMSPAAGQVSGDVYVVVELLDLAGETGRDSVRVTITN
ncbi:MAG: hypothetical protein L7S64_11645 [Longimicrobiales bacterium]|nr:hypothetical protein [Longimicrobiales bacterium]